MRLVSFLSDLPIMDDYPSVADGLRAVLDLGRDHGLTAYDAAYLELAIRTGLPLATLDQTLGKAARDTGVRLYQRN
jgi:predicted nucleic acid-binding protein